MRNTYQGTIYFILAIFFITLGSLTLTGCGAKQTGATEPSVSDGLPPIGEDTDERPFFESVPIEALLASPDSYVDKTVEVYGEVYTIGDAVGTSVTVRISPPDEASVLLLKCEFLSNDLPPSTLKEGRLVTITGKVDIVEAVVFLRECKVKDMD